MKTKAYVRPMAHWWRRDRFFARYMLREATAVAVLVYAIVLMVGLVRLAQGVAAWNGWLAALRSPLSLGLHGVLLVAMFVHAKSWFEIMPKTMPLILPSGRRLSPAMIRRSGWAACVFAGLALFVFAWGWRP